MNKIKIYLSGAERNTTAEFQSWRTHCKMLRQNGYYTTLDFVDPMEYFNYSNKKPQTNKQCLDLYMWQIEKCDLLLLNLDHSDISVGCGMEIEHAFCHNIPIIAFGEKEETWYNWATTRSVVVFRTLEQAIDYINETYAKVVK